MDGKFDLVVFGDKKDVGASFSRKMDNQAALWYSND